jgi:hypothetical protein
MTTFVSTYHKFGISMVWRSYLLLFMLSTLLSPEINLKVLNRLLQNCSKYLHSFFPAFQSPCRCKYKPRVVHKSKALSMLAPRNIAKRTRDGFSHFHHRAAKTSYPSQIKSKSGKLGSGPILVLFKAVLKSFIVATSCALLH